MIINVKTVLSTFFEQIKCLRSLGSQSERKTLELVNLAEIIICFHTTCVFKIILQTLKKKSKPDIVFNILTG